MRGGDERVFEEERLVDAVDSAVGTPFGVDWQRLSVEDAELLVKLLCDLTRELDQVAAVQLAISPVEPVQECD